MNSVAQLVPGVEPRENGKFYYEDQSFQLKDGLDAAIASGEVIAHITKSGLTEVKLEWIRTRVLLAIWCAIYVVAQFLLAYAIDWR